MEEQVRLSFERWYFEGIQMSDSFWLLIYTGR